MEQDVLSSGPNVQNAAAPQYDKRILWLICLVAAMGGFLFGYDWVVVGGAKPFYEPYFFLTSPNEKGWGTSSALVGCVVGAMLCYFYADRYGRKRLLILAGFLFTVSAVGTALANTFLWFNIYRIVGGFGIGIALNLSPMYIAEMSPPEVRGKFVSVNQLMIMIGILAAQVANWQISLLDTEMPANATEAVIRQSWNGQEGWRWMFGAEALPALIFFVLMIFMPESVRWLVKSGKDEKAKNILKRMGGERYATAELAAIKSTISEEEVSQVHFGALLQPGLFRILMLGFFLAILQQWCGMNVVFYYAADIFLAAGYDMKQMMLQIVVIGSVMVISVIFTILLVDRYGRKTLMLLGTGCLAAIYIVEGFFFQAGVEGIPIVVLTLASVAVYSFTLAPVVWVILSEIFPNRIRGAAMSLAAVTLWIGNFSLTFTFPSIKEALGWSLNFWLYAAICMAGFLVIYLKLPETKGRSLEEIEKQLGV
ncbi:MAG TPA: sugar porter family MFS transporter [Chryseosolibacter sp.]